MDWYRGTHCFHPSGDACVRRGTRGAAGLVGRRAGMRATREGRTKRGTERCGAGRGGRPSRVRPIARGENDEKVP